VFAYCLLLCLLFSKFAYGNQDIIIISSSGAPVYQQTVEVINQTLAQGNLLQNRVIQPFTIEQLEEQDATHPTRGPKALVITIGSAAADYATQHFIGSPIICGFITRNAFAAITSKLQTPSNITAVYMDQSLQRLFNLATLLRDNQPSYKIGMLSQNTEALKHLTNGKKRQDIEIQSAMLDKNKNPMKVIEPLMKTSDVFIVRPNTSLFNRLVAKLVLQLSMRHKTPVIGFSKNYAQAGALLSLYSSPEDIGKDTANMINHWLRSPEQALPEPQEGSNFSIATNHRIAKKMAMPIDADTLSLELQNMEGK